METEQHIIDDEQTVVDETSNSVEQDEEAAVQEAPLAEAEDTEANASQDEKEVAEATDVETEALPSEPATAEENKASTADESPAAETTDSPASSKNANSKTRWYIVHAYSGFEKKVAAAIEEQAVKKGLDKYFDEVVVPTETVVEVKKGKKVNTERKFFPGYVLVKVEMNDDVWHLVKNTPKVTGFVGGTSNKPLPISDQEAAHIFNQIEEGMTSPRHKVVYQVGDSVKVIDGPFDSFVGTVEEIDDEREKLRVSVAIFGRPTPVELEYTQVEKA